jgi:hypothetical protein
MNSTNQPEATRTTLVVEQRADGWYGCVTGANAHGGSYAGGEQGPFRTRNQALESAWVPLVDADYVSPAGMVTPAEAAALSGTTESAWHTAATTGQLPGAFRDGTHWLIPRSAVTAGGAR